MFPDGWYGNRALGILGGLILAAVPGCVIAQNGPSLPQEETVPPQALNISNAAPPVPYSPPAPVPSDRPLPINLPTALQLAGVRPLDIAVASRRIQVAAAQLEAAQVLWLPTLYLGVDYLRHDGQVQDVQGNILGTSKGSFMAGAGPTAVFAITDAIFSPLAARQVVQAQNAELQAARNDSLLAVGEAYANIEQAQGELAGALDTARRAEELVRRTEQLAPALAPPVEIVRARAELARQRQAVAAARERWRISSAELARVLRLDAAALVQPMEPPHLQITLVPLDRPVDDMIRVALTNRPELAAQRALVEATLERLRQERLRPLVPSVVLHGASTPPETLGVGVFGGGLNSSLSNFSARSDIDIELLWELRNLGFGNRALVRQRGAENQLAMLELFRTQDQIAAEVAQSFAQAQAAAQRVGDAANELRDAAESAQKNFKGLSETKRAGTLAVLVIRPQEAVAALRELVLAYNDYYGAVADYNRAQFRLYRALGYPAQVLLDDPRRQDQMP
jgi:outer membrane protein TolC